MPISIENQQKEKDIRERGNINLKGTNIIKLGQNLITFL